MATVRSLGLHEPSAIPFLVAENLLPRDPSEDQYVWETSVDEDSRSLVDDELVWTKTCVVWSRAGVVRRVFRLDPEKEEIRHALFTYFAVEQIKRSNGAVNNTGRARLQSSRGNGSKLVASGLTLHLSDGDVPAIGAQPDNGLSRALVVVLKSQAHIFFLSGNTHVIPLPFEVDSVFATPRGLLFQRKISDEHLDPYPMAPPNSFMSSIPATDFRASQSHEIPSRPSLTTFPAQGQKRTLKSRRSDLPRVFSLLDPQSEMGLVVSTQTSRFLSSSTGSRSGLDTLDPSDEVVYVSPKNELSGPSRTLIDEPLILVVTVNANTGLYTLWRARYKDDETGSSKKKRRRDTGNWSKRRSSHFGMATGATTPVVHSSVARESFGPAGDWGSSFTHSQNLPKEKSDEDDFASKIQQDLGDIDVPLKASRRVSSFLARADLASSHDRVTFSDLATGSQSSSIHGGFRQSMGGVSNRASFGFNPRTSLPAGNGSVYSASTSFADAPIDKLLEELNNDVSEGFESMDLKDSASGLPEEVILSKVESFSPKFSGSFQSSKSTPRRRLKVSTLCSSGCGSAQHGNTATMAVSIVDQDAKSMTIVNLKVDKVPIPRKEKVFKRAKNGASNDRSLLVQATSIHHFSDVWDACKVVDGDISRILTLSGVDNSQTQLSLQSPWGSPSTIDIPEKLMLYEPYSISPSKSVTRSREGGMSRVLTDSSPTMIGLDHLSSHGKFDVVDSKNRRHKLQIHMEPRNELVKNMLRVCKFVLRDFEKAGDGILVGWWEVMKWLRAREVVENDLEWTAIIIVLFAMAIPFVANDRTQPARPMRRRKGFLRSSSGSYVDLESWETMLDQESGSAGVVAPWMMNSSWGWVVEQDANENSNTRGKSAAREPMSSRSTFRQNSYLRRCASLTREFLRSPHGTVASGPEGYLPTASCYPQNCRRAALSTMLVGLHLLREEQKLSICEADQAYSVLGLLAPVLAQLGRWLGWKSWTWAEGGYFGLEVASMDRWLFEDTQITLFDVPCEPFPPPSIFSYLENAWHKPSALFLNLMDLVTASDRAPRKGKLWQECFSLTPRALALSGFFSELHRSSSSLDRVKLLYRWGLTRSVIETFPEGVSAPLYEAVMQAQVRASTSWNITPLELIDRDDLFMSMNVNNSPPRTTPLQPTLSHDAVRDFHNIGSSTLDIDTTTAFEASAEADRLSVTRLIFRDDKRFVEAARLLNQSKAPVAECAQEPDWSESDLLEAQKELVQLVTLRTLSVPTGRAMLSFSGRLPLLTEKLPIPSFSLQCVMKPMNVTVSADRAAFSEEKVCWAFFHNGVSTGLAISKASKGIDTSWILFNKPQELTNRHAGFLLALGLNGQLKSLAKWVAFKYLTPKHTMTSIGLLLGLSASYLGTMDTLITRLLSVHVTRMLPLGAAELNLSPMTQTAGIMGIGLLYCNSQHRRMSEVMLSEIENAEREDSSMSHEELRDEGYRLAAGFALGFINLGKGKDLRGMRDMHIVERLLAIAVGTKNVDLAHVLDRATAGATIALAIIFMKTNDEILARKIDIPDTTVRFDYVRPDLFLLRTLARHLIMWDSIEPSDEWFMQSLPKIYRRRYRLTNIRRLKSDDMPFFNIISGLCFALGLRFAGSGQRQVRDLLISYLDQFIRICRLQAVNYDGRLARNSVRNCQDIVALSAATVMAGTGDLALFRRLRSLHGRVDHDTPYGSHMAAHMAIGMLFLGGGSYTLGTSDLATASLLCSLYPVFPTTVLDNKCHLQAFRHFWVLAAEPRCLVPRDIDTRRPISAPIIITTKDDTTLKATAPSLLPDIDCIAKVEVRSPDHWPLILDFSGPNNALRDKFRQGDQSIYLRHKTTYSLSSSSIFASTLSSLSEAQDVLPSSSSVSNHSKGLPPPLPNLDMLLSSTRAATSKNTPGSFFSSPSQSPWDWIFNLSSLQGLDIRERGLVMSASSLRIRKSDQSAVSYAPWLRLSAIDNMLVLGSTVQDVIRAAAATTTSSGAVAIGENGRAAQPDEVRDRIWQLRLLFSWIDRERRRGGDEDYEEDDEGEKTADADGTLGAGNGLWLRKEFIEEAKWKVWGVQRES